MFQSGQKQARHRSDVTINNTQVLVYRGSDWVSVPWLDIKVGDIVKVVDNGSFPADLLLLQSSLRQGMCNIETSNLDG